MAVPLLLVLGVGALAVELLGGDSKKKPITNTAGDRGGDGLDPGMKEPLRSATKMLLASAVATPEELDAAAAAADSQGFPMAAALLRAKAAMIRAQHPATPPAQGDNGAPHPNGGGTTNGEFDQGSNIPGTGIASTGNAATDNAIASGVDAVRNIGAQLGGMGGQLNQPSVIDSLPRSGDSSDDFSGG